MKLEQQVCSLDLAKRLEELRVKQESLFFWENLNGEWGLTIADEATRDVVSAFTVAEVGEMLSKASRKSFEIAYSEVMDLVPADVQSVQMAHNLMTQPDIGTKMLIYLLENKLITL